MEYMALVLFDFSGSIDLKKKNMNKSIPNIPTVSSSKNPREVLLIYGELKAKKNAEKSPASLPPMSLPTKYATKTVTVAIITGKMTTKLKSGSAVKGW